MARSPHRYKFAQDLAWRGGGAGLIALATLALRLVVAVAGRGGVAAFVLAAAGFLAASAGATALCLGRHVRDRVPISARWARRS